MMKYIKWVMLAMMVWLFLIAGSRETAVAQEENETPNLFGVIESYEDPAKAESLGVGWTRIRFQWADAQASGPDSWEPAVTDEQIDAEIEAGRDVVGLLIGIPDWARDDNDLPAGLYLPYDDPDNTWAVFVREAVKRYDGRITHWIIWNEPDIADPETPGHTWDGDVADFVQLLRIAYLAAKETNPDVVIHLPAITYFWDPEYIDIFFDTLMASPEAVENDYYFDVATAHLYFQPGSVYDLIQLFYEAMASRGMAGKPVWLVETNAPPVDDPYWLVDEWTLSVTLTEQAAFMPQAMVSALAAGAERIAVYKLKDTPGDKAANPEPFGLVHRDGSRRPAFDAYRVAIQQLSGATDGAELAETAVIRQRWDEIGQFQVYQEEQTITVLFSRLPAPQVAQVTALVEQAILVDMWGKRLDDVLARDGRFTIELPGAFCSQSIGDYCMIGGATYYLIQETAIVPPSPTATSTPTNTPTNTPTPTAVHPPTPLPTPSAAPTNAKVMSTTTSETAASISSTQTVLPTPTPIIAPENSANSTLYWGVGLVGLLLILLLIRWGWTHVVR